MVKRAMAAALVVVALAGCDSSSASTHPSPSGTTTASVAPSSGSAMTAAAVPTVTDTAAPSRSVSSPAPTVLSDAEQAYLLRLEAVDARLTANDLDALRRGRALCEQVLVGGPRDRLVAKVQRGYANVPLSSGKATQVLYALQFMCESPR